MAPGPAPRAPADLLPREGEDLCYLAGDFRIFQRIDGHRWSVDDLVTAWTAVQAVAERPPRMALDLGCGVGTVLMLIAWRFPAARVIGIEAQDVSVELARRSLAWNGIDDRCEVVHGDLREIAPDGTFDLVTGTPPYFERGRGVESDRVQRAPCRFEHRGGIEEYAAVAARRLAPGAPFVACETAGERARVAAAAAAAGLAIERWRDVIPREGKAPLFSTFVLRRLGEAARCIEHPALVVRDRHGRWTAPFIDVRHEMGMPA